MADFVNASMITPLYDHLDLASKVESDNSTTLIKIQQRCKKLIDEFIGKKHFRQEPLSDIYWSTLSLQLSFGGTL